MLRILKKNSLKRVLSSSREYWGYFDITSKRSSEFEFWGELENRETFSGSKFSPATVTRLPRKGTWLKAMPGQLFFNVVRSNPSACHLLCDGHLWFKWLKIGVCPWSAGSTPGHPSPMGPNELWTCPHDGAAREEHEGTGIASDIVSNKATHTHWNQKKKNVSPPSLLRELKWLIQ